MKTVNALIIAAVVLGAATMAHAVPVTVEFEFEIVGAMGLDGALVGQTGRGSFSYLTDAPNVHPFPTEFVGQYPGQEFVFEITVPDAPVLLTNDFLMLIEDNGKSPGLAGDKWKITSENVMTDDFEGLQYLALFFLMEPDALENGTLPLVGPTMDQIATFPGNQYSNFHGFFYNHESTSQATKML